MVAGIGLHLLLGQIAFDGRIISSPRIRSSSAVSSKRRQRGTDRIAPGIPL